MTAILIALLFLVTGVRAETTLPTENDNGSSASPSSKVLKTYFLSVLPGGSKREVKLIPPAIRLAVVSQSGDTTVRCGDGRQSYSCAPGKRLELEADAESPIAKIWAENPNENQVRLRIDVYEIPQANDAEVGYIMGLMGCQFIGPSSRFWNSVFGTTPQHIINCGF